MNTKFIKEALQVMEWSGVNVMYGTTAVYVPDTEVLWCTVQQPDGDEWDWLEPEFNCGNSPSLQETLEGCDDGEYTVYWRKKGTIMIDFAGEAFHPEDYGPSADGIVYTVKDGKVDREVLVEWP